MSSKRNCSFYALVVGLVLRRSRHPAPGTPRDGEVSFYALVVGLVLRPVHPIEPQAQLPRFYALVVGLVLRLRPYRPIAKTRNSSFYALVVGLVLRQLTRGAHLVGAV